MTGRRGMVAALGLTAAGAVLVLATAGQARWTSGGADLRGGAAPAATAFALVALAGIGLLLLVGGRVRTVLGVLLVLAGAGVVLADLAVPMPEMFATSLGPSVQATHSVWFWLTAGGGAAIAVGGGVVTAVGHRWPGPRRDYRPPAGAESRRPDAWSALDRGEDPTA